MSIQPATRDEQDFRARWSPPPRPDWVGQVNREGDWLDLGGVVPLDADSLIATACRNTRLTDFGDDAWREPFGVLVKSLDHEANLNLMGRILTRTDMLMFLEGRLQIEDWYRRHPEIEEERIEAPFLIVGQGRSGTSFLLNLLELDPNNATCKEWEAMMPCPPPEATTYRSDSRIALCDKRVTMWNRVVPELESVHEFTAEIPTETIHLKAFSFECPAWMNILGQVPSYNAYMATRPMLNALRYEKRVLKLLQWRNPRRRWVMKDPDSIRYLPDVLQVYPDARCVWPHRDPGRARSSGINMIGILGWIRSDRLFVSGANEQITDELQTAAMLTQPIEWIEQGLLPAARLCNIHYEDLVADPLATIERVYRHFGLNLSDGARDAIGAYLRARPRSERPEHAYAAYGADADQADDPFSAYRRYFSV